jgi:hypothetical protein
VNSAAIFVRAATFGQLTKHIFDHGGVESKLQKSLPPWHLTFPEQIHRACAFHLEILACCAEQPTAKAKVVAVISILVLMCILSC